MSDECNCTICRESKRIDRIVKTKDVKKLTALITELRNHICNVELDNNVNTAIMAGSWPSALETLTKAIQKAEKYRADHKESYFQCPKCKMKSYNKEDIKNGYCGNCHKFYKEG